MKAAEARAIMGVGFSAAFGDRERLRRAFAEAADLLPVEDVEEYLLQTYLFAGFPRTINAFFVWQSWIVENGSRATLPAPETDDPVEWRRRGETLCRIVYGADYEALQRRLARLHPALAEWTLVEGYGKVLSRQGPDPARRELAAVGSLIAMRAERQLASHLRGAVHAGVALDQLAEAVRETAAENGYGERVEALLEALGET